MSITPDEYRAHCAAVDSEAAFFKLIPTLNYEMTLQMLLNKAALTGEIPQLLADTVELVAKMLAGMDHDAAMNILNLIHLRMHEHEKQLAEFVAAGVTADAMDKAAMKPPEPLLTCHKCRHQQARVEGEMQTCAKCGSNEVWV